jgi:putative ABC transport system substrate-binding protein
MRHIGVLMGLPEDDPEAKARVVKFRQQLERLGWSEGNVSIDIRFAPAGAQAQALAKELVAMRPDVILAHAAQIAAALHRETRAIPVVFVNLSDPIGAGPARGQFHRSAALRGRHRRQVARIAQGDRAAPCARCAGS